MQCFSHASVVLMVAAAKQKQHYPLTIIAQAKGMYVVKGLSPKDIGPKLGVRTAQVQNWINKRGWKAERVARMQEFAARAESQMASSDEAFLQAMATQSEELAYDTFDVAREAVGRTGTEYAAKDLASASAATKNYLDVFMRARGLDRKSAQVTVSIGSLFIGEQQAAEPKPIDVTPAADEPRALPEAKA
jgi:hypothetical protein